MITYGGEHGFDGDYEAYGACRGCIYLVNMIQANNNWQR